MKKVLSIAGSDCSGGAGIQADLKTFSAHGIFGMSVITSVVAENTQRVISYQNIKPDLINQQIEAVFEDIPPDAVKIGMLPCKSTMLCVFDSLTELKPKNIVIDPVMYAKNGCALMSPNCIYTLIDKIIPLADILTPNIPEAEKISCITIKDVEDVKRAAERIYEMGCGSVLIKGGHSDNDATDVLYDGKQFYYYAKSRIHTKNTHGTGCTLSSAIASNLALGMEVHKAVGRAKDYITTAIEHSLAIGKGNGPTNHFYNLYNHGLKEVAYEK